MQLVDRLLSLVETLKRFADSRVGKLGFEDLRNAEINLIIQLTKQFIK